MPARVTRGEGIIYQELEPVGRFTVNQTSDILGAQHPCFGAVDTIVPAAGIYRVRKGYVQLGREEVFSHRKNVLADISAQKINPKIGTSKASLCTATRLHGRVLSLSLSGLEKNYYHFHVEWMARWYLYRISGLEVDFYHLSVDMPFQRDFVGFLGLDSTRILSGASGQVFQADEVVVPTLINNWEPVMFRGFQSAMKQYLPTWFSFVHRKIFGTRARAIQNGHPSRLYVSRADAPGRHVTNERELLKVLIEFGFQELRLEELDLFEQLELFSQAEAIVAPHGAGLANMVFSNRGLRVLELFPEYYHDQSFRFLAHAMGHHYSYLVGKTEIGNGASPQREDLSIDCSCVATWACDLDKVRTPLPSEVGHNANNKERTQRG